MLPSLCKHLAGTHPELPQASRIDFCAAFIVNLPISRIQNREFVSGTQGFEKILLLLMKRRIICQLKQTKGRGLCREGTGDGHPFLHAAPHSKQNRERNRSDKGETAWCAPVSICGRVMQRLKSRG